MQFYSDLSILQARLRRAGLMGTSSADEIRAWGDDARELLEGYSGAWPTYPLQVAGDPYCTPAEAEFRRKHDLTMIQLYVLHGLDKVGSAADRRELLDLRADFEWLGSNTPPRFQPVMGTYTNNLDFVNRRLGSVKTGDVPPREASPVAESAKQGGCYVATAVYGSYDCPQVWTLRKYRDSCLAPTPTGRTMIRVYYAVSPALVRRYGDSLLLRQVAKPILDRVVRRLQARGYASTPYSDRSDLAG